MPAGLAQVMLSILMRRTAETGVRERMVPQSEIRVGEKVLVVNGVQE